MNETIVEYDIYGRIIYMKTDFGLEYIYEYSSDKEDCDRTVTILYKNNKSNYKTVTEQKCVDETYIDKYIKEYGQKYDTKIICDDLGRRTFIERINKSKNTKYTKDTVFSKDNIPILWREDYNGVMNIGFKVDIDKLIK